MTQQEPNFVLIEGELIDINSVMMVEDILTVNGKSSFNLVFKNRVVKSYHAHSEFNVQLNIFRNKIVSIIADSNNPLKIVGGDMINTNPTRQMYQS